MSLEARLAAAFAATALVMGSFLSHARAAETGLGAGSVVVAANGLTAVAPPPGHGVYVGALTIDGRDLDLLVRTRGDGTVDVRAGDAIAAIRLPSGSRAAVSPDACSDGAYATLPYRWASTYQWWFRASSTPGGVAVSNAERALRGATSNITFGRNDCGLADAVEVLASYQGRTDEGTQVLSTGGCGSGEGKSVTSFGVLPAGFLGLTCAWFGGGVATESDMKLSTKVTWRVVLPRTCSSIFSVEDAATHERGHAFGLAHVDEGAHGNLTMSPVMQACQTAETTLGLGDVRGLEAKY